MWGYIFSGSRNYNLDTFVVRYRASHSKVKRLPNSWVKIFQFSNSVKYYVKIAISNVILPSFQDVCDQFTSQMENGQLTCTQESDPVQGPGGRTHGNTCAMCKEKLWVIFQKWAFSCES